MTSGELAKCLGAEILADDTRLEEQIENVYVGNRVSDLLTQVGEKTLVVSELGGAALVRAAALVDAPAICFVDGSRPDSKVVRVAKELGIALLVSPVGLQDTCALVNRHLGKTGGTDS